MSSAIVDFLKYVVLITYFRPWLSFVHDIYVHGAFQKIMADPKSHTTALDLMAPNKRSCDLSKVVLDNRVVQENTKKNTVKVLAI